MDKEKKNRSGSISNASDKNEKEGGRKRTDLKGSPPKSNRQTGDRRRNERDDSTSGASENTTKKGANSI